MIDTKADDVFYYGQGKAYAYYLLFKALGHDYKNIIVKKDAYGIWKWNLLQMSWNKKDILLTGLFSLIFTI